MTIQYREHILNRESIESVSAQLQDYLKELKTERHNVQRIRLIIEEILLNMMEHGCLQKKSRWA